MGPSNVVGERFELLALVGAGGMGRVYRARDLVTGGDAAVKVLDEKSHEGARFDREAALLAELDHPAIVRYFGHGTTPAGLRYLAMEWLQGEDLRARLRRKELSTPEALALAERAATALAAAHERGIIHRDIKPGNIYLPDDDAARAKIIDFGIAHATSIARLTLTGSMLGTPGYMAPEQARGLRDIDGRADVYSLGCVLFRCLTGRVPFVGETSLAVVIKATVEDAPRLGELRPDLPRALEDLVARMLDRDPAARPRDGRALAEELRSLGQMPLSMRPRSLAPPALTGAERRLGCFLVARTSAPLPAAPAADATPSETTGIELSALVQRFGGRLCPLADSALFVTFTADGSGPPEVPTDLAVRAARCAAGLAAVLPGAKMALSAGQTVLSGWAPAGEAIDRGAALLERARPDEVRLDAVMERLLEGRFATGKDEAGAFLRDELDAGAPVRTLLGKPIAIVGRDAELLRLESFAAESASESVARAVVVTASAGMGKSRLLHELLRRLAIPRAGADTAPPPAVWVGRGDMMSVRSPHAVVGSAIRKAARISGGEPLGLRRQKLLARVLRCLPKAEATRVAAFLGEIAGAPFPDDRGELFAARQDPHVLGDQVRRAWIDWLRAETAIHPVVLVLEDLHWGDTPSVTLIDAALGALSETPLFVLVLARPELEEAFPDLFATRAVVGIQLSGLSKRASEKLVRSALGAQAPAAEVERIVLRAAGNAFCLEELIREAAEGRGDTLPETVLAMVHARLDRLAPDARRVLRAASVFGERFWREGVIEVLGEGDAWIDPVLADLARRELVEPRGESKLPHKEAFAFRHAIVRDAAYALFTNEDLQESHARAGDFLERAGEEDNVVLARHFQLGGAPLRASHYYGRAGLKAMEGNDLTQALAHAGSALACGAAGADRGALLVLEGEAHGWRGELALAERCCSEAMTLLPAGSALWCQAAGGAVMAYLQLGHLARFVDVARRLGEVEPATDAIDRYVLGAVLVLAYLWTGGLYDLARSFMERTERIADKGVADATTLVMGEASGARGGMRPTVNDADPRPPGMAALSSFSAMGWLGWARSVQVKYTVSDPWLHRKLASDAAVCFRRAGDARGALRVRIEVGIGHRNLGEHDASVEALEEARAIASQLGVLFFVASAEVHLSSTLLQAARWDDAERVARTAMETCASADNHILGALARGNLAMVTLRRGDAATAHAEIEQALSVLVAPPARAYCLASLAEVRLARGDIAGALEAAEEAGSIVDRLGTLPEGDAYTRCILSEALHAAGRPSEALAAITAAADRLSRRASGIPDPAARRRFLEDVPPNARTFDRLRAFSSEHG